MIFTSRSFEIEAWAKRHGSSNDEGRKVNVKFDMRKETESLNKKNRFLQRWKIFFIRFEFKAMCFNCNVSLLLLPVFVFGV